LYKNGLIFFFNTSGPYEWLDCEIIKLSYLFKSRVLVSPYNGNENNINVTLTIVVGSWLVGIFNLTCCE